MQKHVFFKRLPNVLSVEYVVVVQLTVQLNCIFFFRFGVDTANVFSADLHVVPITDVRWGFLGVQVYKTKQLHASCPCL